MPGLALGFGGLGRRRNEVDEPLARRTLLDHRLSTEAMEELRGQGHVACLAGAVGRLSDADAFLAADHLVATVDDGREALERRRPLDQLALLLLLDLAQPGVDVALARAELGLELL